MFVFPDNDYAPEIKRYLANSNVACKNDGFNVLSAGQTIQFESKAKAHARCYWAFYAPGAGNLQITLDEFKVSIWFFVWSNFCMRRFCTGKIIVAHCTLVQIEMISFKNYIWVFYTIKRHYMDKNAIFQCFLGALWALSNHNAKFYTFASYAQN